MAVLPTPVIQAAGGESQYHRAEDGARAARIQYVSQFVTDLRNITGYYIGWIPEDQSFDSFVETIENDPAVRHASNLLSLMTAGEYFTIKSADKKLNQILTRSLQHIHRFNHVRKSMVEKSVIYGLSVLKKKWAKVTWPEFPGMTWEVPVDLKEVDRRRMRLERNAEDRNEVYWTIWDPKYDRYMILEDRAKEPGASLALQDFLWLFYEHEEAHPYFKGLGTSLYQLAYVKSRTMQYWSSLGEHWGKPLIVATIAAANAAFNGAANSQSGTADASKIMSNWLEILENMRSRHVAVMPDHDKINFHEAGSTGNNILSELIDYCDRRIQLLLLGAELTTMAPSVGSYAMGQLHKGATNSIIHYLRTGIEEVLVDDLMFDFYLRNRYNFGQLGIKWPGKGMVKMALKVEIEDQKDQMMQEMGGKKDLEGMGVVRCEDKG